MYEHTQLEAALRAFGDVLSDRGESFTVVAIGGGALALRGFVVRPTEDIDVVALLEADALTSAQPLPAALAIAIADVAQLIGLHPKWMNGEPTGLLARGLPTGFLERTERRRMGGLTLLLADRFDQIHLKVLAASRPGDKHHMDLRALSPTREELLSAAAWARTQATSDGFEAELRGLLSSFGVELEDV